jgi:diketogulonate reductase-like aldo/keto reductase
MIGLGTDGIQDSEIIYKAIVDIGYRLIDTASRYKNEVAVGKGVNFALQSGKVSRKEMFVVTKVWIDEVEDVVAACRRSLGRLGLEYVDLYLLHWPIAVREDHQDDGSVTFEKLKIPIHKIWPQLESLVDYGLAKSIGVSNFNV